MNTSGVESEEEGEQTHDDEKIFKRIDFSTQARCIYENPIFIINEKHEHENGGREEKKK